MDSSTYLTGITSGNVTTALGYTPVTNARTLTINGTTYDLTANRSWTISTGTTLNGTGFVKASGTTISYDNSTYLTTSSAASTYLALAGGTMTGNLMLANFYTSSGKGYTAGASGIRVVPVGTLSLNTTYLISVTITGSTRWTSGAFLWRPIANGGFSNYPPANVYFPTNTNVNGVALYAFSSTGNGASSAGDVVVNSNAFDMNGATWSATVKLIG